jgi:uncharacterized protein (TIGR00730 family)
VALKHVKSICVYCGANSGSNPVFVAAAKELGKLLAENDIGLVYGGASIGIMGALADSVLEHGGHVTGIIPHGLFQREVAHNGISKLLVVDSMHDRKSLIAHLSDAIVTLPGGYGTFEELFEMITWNQIGIHQKPIFILNTAGFYDPFQAFISNVIENGFIRDTVKQPYKVLEKPVDVIEELSAYIPISTVTPVVNP